MFGTADIVISYPTVCIRLEDRSTGGANMVIRQTQRSAEARNRVARLEVARRVYQALIAQDPERLITLRDAGGRAVARHDPRPEEGDQKIVS
jgi:hypothetical protein